MQNDQPFDADAFMSATIDQPLETEFKLCPEGTFQAMIGDFDSTAFEVIDFEYKKGERAGTPGSMTKFNLPFVIKDDPKVKSVMDRDSVTVAKQIILDRAADGSLDFGINKNVALGQVRKAVNQNAPGPWAPGQLRGVGPVMVKVKHDRFKRADGSEGRRAVITEVAPVR